MKLVELRTSTGKAIRSSFNPMTIVKVAESDSGNTFVDTMDIGRKGFISNWTIYEPYATVVAKINEALK